MQIRHLFRIAVMCLITYLTYTTPVHAQNPNPECPPQSEIIWVLRDFYGDPPGESLSIPFESGTHPDDDPNDNEGVLNNYLAGVLEKEMGPTNESPELHPEAGKAIAIAARSVAYRWCNAVPVTVIDVDGVLHSGVNDHSRQHYDPNHVQDQAIDEQYRQFVAQTADQHLTYNNQYFALLFRTYVSPETNSSFPNPPHKSIPDPVSSPDEVSNSGMGLHSANHWAIGAHNEVGCDLSSVCSSSSPSPDQWRPNLVWDYRRILAHYYSEVEFNDFYDDFPLKHRWNMLTTSLDGAEVLPVGTTRAVTIRIQNTSTQTYDNTDFTRYHKIKYTWDMTGILPNGCDGNSSQSAPHVPVPTMNDTVSISVPLAAGDDTTATIDVEMPTVPGFYTLQWDMQREERYQIAEPWDLIRFSNSNEEDNDEEWPLQEQSFKLCLFDNQQYLPLITAPIPVQ